MLTYATYRYSFAAIMQNEFIGLNFTCTKEDTAKWVESLEESTREHVLEFVHLLPCPTPDGETHLKRLKVSYMSVYTISFSVSACANARITAFYMEMVLVCVCVCVCVCVRVRVRVKGPNVCL